MAAATVLSPLVAICTNKFSSEELSTWDCDPLDQKSFSFEIWSLTDWHVKSMSRDVKFMHNNGTTKNTSDFIPHRPRLSLSLETFKDPGQPISHLRTPSDPLRADWVSPVPQLVACPEPDKLRLHDSKRSGRTIDEILQYKQHTWTHRGPSFHCQHFLKSRPTLEPFRHKTELAKQLMSDRSIKIQSVGVEWVPNHLFQLWWCSS